MKTVKIAMIGVGSISEIYLENITKTFKEIDLIGLYDVLKDRAESAAEKYNVPKVYSSLDEALADPEVDIVLNLTRPYQHYDITKAALLAGKHVYTEKPLGATLDEGKELVKLAKEKNLLICGAPDTFMGAGIQTCRDLIDSGKYGKVIGAAARWATRGHESWHPDPDFYYQKGGGPMFDMGPYYLTALVNLLGGVSSVCGMVTKAFDTRTITGDNVHKGEIIQVNAPTHINGIMKFDSGVTATITTSFDVQHSQCPLIEVYMEDATIFVPDPNYFDGPIKVFLPDDSTEEVEKKIHEIPLTFPYNENSRSLGIADMAKAITTGRRARADYSQILHILEVMEGFTTSSETGKFVDIENKFTRSQPMDPAFGDGILD